jgi:hypothetical protein
MPAISEIDTSSRARRTMVSADWVQPLIERAHKPQFWDAATPFVDPIELAPGYNGLRLAGNLRPHTDLAFPKWCYLLVFRGGRTHMTMHRKQNIRLRAGMLFELDEHRRHSVVQRPSDLMVWTPLDSDQRLSLDEALERHRQLRDTGTFVLADKSKLKSIDRKGFKIVYDTRIVWVHDAHGACVARFGRGGYALCAAAAAKPDTPPTYLLLTHRTPHPAGWARWVEGVRRTHSVRIPTRVMPKFLRAGEKAI